ncbi:hypothetical protein Q3G72_008649 [Acer saccharum]|nr:hypothetical protein Q3G72_008649 [Acer saccharum]
MARARSTGNEQPRYGDRVVDLYVERIEALQIIDGNELIPSQQPKSQVHSYGITDDDHNGALVAEEEDCEVLIGERANFERNRKGKQVQVDPESDDGGDLVESDYEQEVEDIAVETCYDPSNLWETLQVP